MADIGGKWCMKKMGTDIPPLGKQNRSKKSQDKDNKIKSKLHTSNRNWDDWKFQINSNMHEWVNPRSKIARKTYSTSSKKYYIYQYDITVHWIGH